MLNERSQYWRTLSSQPCLYLISQNNFLTRYKRSKNASYASSYDKSCSKKHWKLAKCVMVPACYFISVKMGGSMDLPLDHSKMPSRKDFWNVERTSLKQARKTAPTGNTIFINKPIKIFLLPFSKPND